jgi:AraC-like DNA-binding protein
VMPDGCPEWIVHAGDEFARSVDGRWRKQPKSFLAGTLSRPWVLLAGVRVRTLGIRFKPGAVCSLFDIDMTGTADSEVDLRKLSDSRVNELADSVLKARTARAMVSSAERGLLALVPSRLRPPKTRKAVDRIRSQRGRGRVEALARAVGMSRRSLERAFQRELGVSPKQYIRIVRLNAALAGLKESERGRLVDVAVDAGYFDESHLSREFKSLTGRMASSREADGELARNFTRLDRLRRLLNGP